MCKFKFLAHHTIGYVVQCRQCNHIQIAFGTTLLNLKPDLYDGFRLQVKSVYSTSQCNGFKHQKQFYLDTNCSCSMMILNRSELEDLQALLSESKFNLEVSELLADKNINQH